LGPVVQVVNTSHRVVALIPARAGSKRAPGKNIRILNGHPLLAYAVATAREAGIFNGVYVSTEDFETARIAERYGAKPILRPPEYARDWSPDIDWVTHALDLLHMAECAPDAFAILRPTSPFRRGAWVYAAWERFVKFGSDSLRAMRPVSEHPCKMWRLQASGGNAGNAVALPLLPFSADSAPWHSMPTQELPRVYVQTAALEIGWACNVQNGTIAGDRVLGWPCESDAPESIDVNTEADWSRCVELAAEHPEYLPTVETPSYAVTP
jgi:CMP-N,N'-diacetyllegionaminic acid synthase